MINAMRPNPAEGEALIRVHLAGICNTDIELVKGYMSFVGIPGHEFVGTVEQSNQKVLLGKRVIGEINAGCGKCELCLNGDSRHCSGRTVLGITGRDGAFAQYLSLPDRNLIPIPDTIPDETAVLIEPLAAAIQILTQIEIRKEYKVLIIGDGKLGILTAIVLQMVNPNVILAGHHIERNKAMLPKTEHIDFSLNEPEPASFDFIIEASGNMEGFQNALKYVRPKGTIILKSTYHGQPPIDTSNIVVNEITVIGSRCGRFEPAINALVSNSVSIPQDYISETFPIDKGIEAVNFAQQKGVLKVLIDMH